MTELSCDICGKMPIRAQILIEGAKLLACSRCMRSGKVLHVFHDEEPGAPGSPPPQHVKTARTEEEIVENYASIIRTAREKRNLTRLELANLIREKENYVIAMENDRLSPTLEVAKKLEKELKIKLIEKPEAGPSSLSSGRTFTEPTMADMVAPVKKKKGK